MKIWQKCVGLLLSCLLASGLMAGCAPQAANSEVDLQIHYWRSGMGEDYMRAIVEEFKKEYPQYNVQLDITSDNSVLGTTIELGADFNTVDVYFSVTPSAKVRREYAEPLDDILTYTNPGESKPIGEKFDPYYIDYMKTEGTDGVDHTYSMSYGGSWTGIVYNADIIDGVNYEVPLTTDDLEILAIDLDAEGYTPFIHFNSPEGGYWKYLYSVWQAQYTGLDFYQDVFYASIGEDGSSPSKERLLDTAKDDGRWQVLEFMEKIMTPEYVEAGSNAGKFTEQQLKFFNDQAVMMVNGGWLQYEMGSRNKNLLMMKPPVLSAIANDKGGRCKSIADDTELRAVIRAVDAAGADRNAVALQGDGYDITKADRDAVYEARNLFSANFDAHGIVIPKYATAKEAAKDFVKFFYRDESILIYMNTLHQVPLATFSDESKLPDMTNWTNWEKQQIQYNEIAIPLMDTTGKKHEIFSTGGADAYAKINFVSRFCSRGQDHRSALQIWDEMQQTFEERWDTYLINAGLMEEK